MRAEITDNKANESSIHEKNFFVRPFFSGKEHLNLAYEVFKRVIPAEERTAKSFLLKTRKVSIHLTGGLALLIPVVNYLVSFIFNRIGFTPKKQDAPNLNTSNLHAPNLPSPQQSPQVSPPVSPSPLVSPVDQISSPKLSQNLLDARKPLKDFIEQYFILDENAYLIAFKAGLNPNDIKEKFQRDQKELALYFYQVSAKGDAAYAQDIRTCLAGMCIGCSSVDKSSGQVLQKPHRPQSYVFSSSKNLDKEAPPHYRQKPAYIGLWEHAIWQGNKHFRQEQFAMQAIQAGKKRDAKDKERDRAITDFQQADYDRRVLRIRELHKKGYLLGRVADTSEAKDFMGHRHGMQNDILSTSLWPEEGSPVQMQLFSEYGTDTVGLLLDPHRAGYDDFGVSFTQNALTVGSGFQSHKARRQDSYAAKFLSAQRGLLQTLSTLVRAGGSVRDISFKPNADHSAYEAEKGDVRGAAMGAAARGGARGRFARASFNAENFVSWNEQTYYRGIEGDMFAGFFVKSDSDDFSKELKQLFILQERFRRKKGVYVPIFQFKGSSNELQEFVPDQLLLNLLGLQGRVTPISGRSNFLSIELAKAGISEAEACQVATAISKQSSNARTLLDLQMLMFNMKDINGKISVKESTFGDHTTFKAIRIIDNLHLVFPTIHQTGNADAEKKELYFSKKDVQAIKQTPQLLAYLQKTQRHNIAKFLGISVDLNTKAVSFDADKMKLFDPKDQKKSDFAKVTARAMQAAVLFNVFGSDSNEIVKEIVKTLRKDLPLLGITPTGTDMLLGSLEMQTCLPNMDLCDKEHKEKKVEASDLPPVPTCPDNLDIDKINPAIAQVNSKLSLPSLTVLEQALLDFGIHEDGSIKNIESFRQIDPHLLQYEKELMKLLVMLNLIDEAELAKTIISNIRGIFPNFGYSVDRKDQSDPQSNERIVWLQRKIKGLSPKREFPIAANPQEALAMPAARGGRFAARGAARGEVLARGRFAAAAAPSAEVSLKLEIDKDAFQKLMQRALGKGKDLISPLAKDLGLMNASNKFLWEVEPQFYDGNKGKPKAPYIEPKDILGEYAGNLMTGPAMQPKVLEADQASVKIHRLGTTFDLKKLMVKTLAMTTEGDQQALRPNGLQFSRAADVPMGGNIQFNGGNEKHRFRSNLERHYAKFGKNPYPYKGGYSEEDLQDVEDYDQKLLSDEERRVKRARVLSSAYVTVTAQGGYACPRKALERAYRVLYMETCGPQFEKYGFGEFSYQNGIKDSNELEVADFIIKQAAKRNVLPLFPKYYDGGIIPGYTEISADKKSKLDDGDFSKPYVVLNDGALFNRQVYQRASDCYLKDLVIPTIKKRLEDKAFYLKATLFGGGFFAQANKAGNLRSEVVHAMVLSYVRAIENNEIPKGSAIEFPRYGNFHDLPQTLRDRLIKASQDKGIDILWTPQGDVCDYSTEYESLSQTAKKLKAEDFESNGCLVVLGAADAMSWSGNESTSASVEAAFANNSNLRLVLNWWANPHVLKLMS